MRPNKQGNAQQHNVPYLAKASANT